MAINNWETARMAGAFSTEQKLKMEDINNEYHLQPVGLGKWDLFPYQVRRFVQEQKIRQPGEPLFSTHEFDNPYAEQPLMFIMNLVPAENSKGASVNKIILEVNNYNKIEIPLSIKPDQQLKLDETGKLMLFEKNWKLIQTIDLAGKIPFLSNGKNKIIIDAEFTGEGTSKLKIEMKTIGKAERITSNKN
jgi:hypothetical protein